MTNLYQAYEQGRILTSQNPMQLVVALYEGGISAVRDAIRCLHAGEIMARAHAVTKAHNILAELQFSLKRDTDETRSISEKLGQLYSYMQGKLLEAHMKQATEPLVEVEGLLTTLLEGWYTVAQKEESAMKSSHPLIGSTEPPVSLGDDDILRVSYGGYYRESFESHSAQAYSF